MNNLRKALVIDSRDNVAVALADLSEGDSCTIEQGDRQIRVVLLHDIPFGHKFSIVSLDQDESVVKYGEEIGKMKEAIKVGGWIHSHNMYCERGMKSGG